MGFRDIESFQTLRLLEQRQVITIGLNTNAANTYYAKQSRVHAFMNLAVLALLILTILGFIVWGWKLGLALLIVTMIVAPIIHGGATTPVRLMLLEDRALFERFYRAGWARIRVNPARPSLAYPDDWELALKHLGLNVDHSDPRQN